MINTTTFSYQHIVSENEIDRLNHVNNVVYVQWVQEAATKHWKLLSKNTQLNEEYSWVVLRHEIDYKKQAKIHDKLTIKTWVGETTGVTSIRFVEIYNENILIAHAKTTWCLIDNQKFKPARITASLLAVLKHK